MHGSLHHQENDPQPSSEKDVIYTPHPTFMQALRFWLKLGFISFGGPTGQIAIMQQEIVEEKRWISTERFLNALNYCMLLPGPEAQQLAIYIGWLLHRVAGGIVAGSLFVILIPKTVLLETEWVLRHGYVIARETIAQSFQKLLGLPNVKAEDPQAVTQALRWYQEGLDFADALHLSSSAKADRFATFDKDFVKKASKLGAIDVFKP